MAEISRDGPQRICQRAGHSSGSFRGHHERSTRHSDAMSGAEAWTRNAHRHAPSLPVTDGGRLYVRDAIIDQQEVPVPPDSFNFVEALRSLSPERNVISERMTAMN